ncbi:hypothetical protein PRIC2_009400 [Phytophthora ramorum]
MRFLSSCLLLLVVSILLDDCTAVSAATDSKKNTPDVSTLVHLRNDIPIQTVPKRLLRAYNFADVADDGNNNEEERGIGLSTVTDLLQSGTSKKLHTYLKNGKSPNEAFKLLKLDTGLDTILTNPKLKTWTKYTTEFNLKNPDNEVSLLSMLTSHYGDDAVAKLLGEAKKTLGTASIAASLQKELFERWLRSGYSVDDVFKLLKFDKEVGSLLKDPKFETLQMYSYQFKSPEKQKSLIATLVAHYGDESVAKMLVVAKTDASTEMVATNLQSSQFYLWFSRSESVPDVYHLLHLKVTDDLLVDPRFNAWVGYANLLKERYPKSEDEMISTLLGTGTSSSTLQRILEAATKVETTRGVAEKLLKEAKTWSRGRLNSIYDLDDQFKTWKHLN